MSKKTLNLVVIGHKGAGKSTLAAHLVGKLGIHDKRLATRFEKEEVTCDFRYSWIQHQLKLEKARTTSIDNTMATIETRDYYCTVLDASGDPDSIRESIKLICQGDVALLVVDSSSDDIGFRCQTREYVLLAYALGLKHIICCCNKMDKTIPQYSEQRYRTILDEVSRYSIQVGYKKDEIQFVPISGLEGENLNQWCLFLDWYSEGTLIEAVNRIKLTRPLDGPLRLPIHAFYKISGIGTVVVGRIQAGVVKPGMEIRIAPPPSELTARVKAIEMHGFPLAEAVPGDNVRLYLGNIAIKGIEQGQVLSDSTVEPAKRTVNFTALVTIQNRKRPIHKGYSSV